MQQMKRQRLDQKAAENFYPEILLGTKTAEEGCMFFIMVRRIAGFLAKEGILK
jgi:hypothetical protein